MTVTHASKCEEFQTNQLVLIVLENYVVT